MSYDYDEAPTELVYEHRMARKRAGTCPECRCSRALHAHGCPEAPDEQRDEETESFYCACEHELTIDEFYSCVSA
jgi:hypothetical protein